MSGRPLSVRRLLYPALIFTLGCSFATVPAVKEEPAPIEPQRLDGQRFEPSAKEGPAPIEPSHLGERIYRQGVLTSGKPLVGTVVGDVELRGLHASCAKCHRRSGFGSAEAGKVTPPITGPRLLQERRPDRAELFRTLYQEPQPDVGYARVRIPRVRRGYDDSTLATAIRKGRDPSGRHLDPLMPRYDLNEADMSKLIAYLKELGAEEPPGVDPQNIHFATVVTPDAPPSQREAMLQVIEAFVREENLETRRYLDRPGISPHYKSELLKGYRRWIVHTWRLEGSSNTFSEQLERLYQKQPVFAMISGISQGSWRPIHEFCQRKELPCLFPNTDLPAHDAEGGYTLYLSHGVDGEAAVLLEFFRREKRFTKRLRIAQAYRNGEAGKLRAEALRRQSRGLPLAIQDVVVKNPKDLNRQIYPDPGWVAMPPPDALVLWLDGADLRQVDLEKTLRVMGPSEVFIPVGSIHGPIGQLAEKLPEGVALVYPYQLPSPRVPQIYRLRSWMHSRRMPQDHENIRLNTHFALSVASHALTHIVDAFSRDYFIERIEHETENALNPGVYPHLSLGPGQRHASKGGYILQVSHREKHHIRLRTDWIAP